MFKKYQHLERFGTTEVQNIELGECHIFPKIDGTNASVWLHNGEIQAGSRTRHLSLEKDNAGFLEWVLKQENLLNYLKENPTHRLFGEWLVPHSLKTYRNDAWRKFYVFEVVEDRDLSELQHDADNHFDLAIVDPPYGIGMSNSNKRTKPSRPNSYTHYPDFRYHEANWDDAIPSEDYFTELFRVSKNQIIWGANYFCKYLPSGTGWIFWNKKNGLDNCFSDGEFAFSSKGVQSKYFECSTFHDLKGGKDRIHPTQKPTKLYDWILANYAQPNDLILDTHLGSGSSRIATYKGGFNFVGFEIDQEYYEKQEKRFNDFKSQLRLF